MKKRHLTVDDTCCFCQSETESTLHAFRDYMFTRCIWLNLRIDRPSGFFWEQNVERWLKLNLSSRSDWSTVFGVAMDQIWRRRNDLIFSNRTHTYTQMVSTIRGRLAAIIQSRILEQRSKPPHLMSAQAEIRWNPPPTGCFSLNCDGSVESSGTNSGFGGVIRDETGKFCFAFAGKLNTNSVLFAELRSIEYGLKVVGDIGTKHIYVYSDIKGAISLILKDCDPQHPFHNIVQSILRLGRTTQVRKWAHVLREANQVADALAHHGAHSTHDICIFDSAPNCIRYHLMADSACISFPRNF